MEGWRIDGSMDGTVEGRIRISHARGPAGPWPGRGTSRPPPTPPGASPPAPRALDHTAFAF
jgi:hypothetical protein